MFLMKRFNKLLCLKMQLLKKIRIGRFDKWPLTFVPKSMVQVAPAVNGPVPMVEWTRIQYVRRTGIVFV